MKDWQSQAHVKWECKYHVVIVPKYRKKKQFKKNRGAIGKIIRELCRQKDVGLLEGNAAIDHLHLLLSVPPKFSIAMTIGYLKGKSNSDSSRTFSYQGHAFWSQFLVSWLLRKHGRA